MCGGYQINIAYCLFFISNWPQVAQAETLPPYVEPEPVKAFLERLVWIYPGLTTHTLMFLSLTSERKQSKNACSACLEAESERKRRNHGKPSCIQYLEFSFQ